MNINTIRSFNSEMLEKYEMKAIYIIVFTGSLHE